MFIKAPASYPPHLGPGCLWHKLRRLKKNPFLITHWDLCQPLGQLTQLFELLRVQRLHLLV